MKIYTRTGDRGETGLIGGGRVSKASARIEAYGAVDELNAALGVAASQTDNPSLRGKIERLQADLHLVCADLANPDPEAEAPRVGERHVTALEALCDEADAQLSPLKRFILPGGSPAGAGLHFARTVARRAERRAVELAADEPVNAETVRYLNRLSDLLFLLARWINHRDGAVESHPDYR